jgi:hypothetical protein
MRMWTQFEWLTVKDHWWAPVNTKIGIGVPYQGGQFLEL